LERGQDRRQILAEQCLGVEPQPRKLLTAKHPVAWRQGIIVRTPEDEPVDGLFEHPPDKILTDRMPALDLELGVQVDTGTRRRDLRHQFRATLDVTIPVDLGLASASRLDHQEGIGLGLVGLIQAEGRVVPSPDAGRVRPVEKEAALDNCMRAAFDQFSLFRSGMAL
jgi:hypothetical protein